MITQTQAKVRSSWQQALAEAYTDPAELLRELALDPQQFAHHFPARKLFAMRVPRPFAALMQPGDPHDPLLRQVLPLDDEFSEFPGFSSDPLDEHDSQLPGLLHKYQSRVLLMVRSGCAVNCRYCFRRHFPYADNQPGRAGMDEALDYIGKHPEINEVILSGGDPLMARDDQLASLTAQLAGIPHLTRLRVHSRLPVVIPQRVTDELVSWLTQSRLKPVLVLHINHPAELGPELISACHRLRQAGVTLLNQGVLLRGVNDCADTLCQLSERLFQAGVLPYYLHLLDKVRGAAHFEVSETQARALQAEQLRRLPGYLVPRLVREIGGEASKTPLDLQLI